MALVSRVWTAFWGAFFHNLCRQFLALCGPAGCELCSMASVSPVWTAFWAAFFHNLCGQFLALCSPTGCELCSMASVSPVWTAFWAAFFSQFVRTRMGVLGIDTFSRACSFPGSFWPCAGLQGVNYAVWPQYHLFGPLFGPHFFTICADKNGGLGIDT